MFNGLGLIQSSASRLTSTRVCSDKVRSFFQLVSSHLILPVFRVGACSHKGKADWREMDDSRMRGDKAHDGNFLLLYVDNYQLQTVFQ